MYYCAVHKEDVKNVLGQMLEPSTDHMVYHSGYDRDGFMEFCRKQGFLALIEMQRCPEAKFGWKFDHEIPLYIPH